MRRSKRIHNSAGAAAQPCLMQNYHKALVLFSKAQQLDFLFSAFFSLLARELMPAAESVAGCKLFKRESAQTDYKTLGSFQSREFQLTHQKLFHWPVFCVFFFPKTQLTSVAIETAVSNFRAYIMCANAPANNTRLKNKQT